MGTVTSDLKKCLVETNGQVDPELEYQKLQGLAGELAEALADALRLIDAIGVGGVDKQQAIQNLHYDRGRAEDALENWEKQDFGDYE